LVEQLEIRGIVDICLDNKGVGASLEGLVVTMFDQPVPGLDNNHIEFFKEFRGKEVDVFPDGLQPIAEIGIQNAAVPGHLPDHDRVVCQLLEAVIIDVQAKA
jgi:hypothetical protein